MVSILFLAADPTNASRLRLGEELREIQEKLQLSRWRDQFNLHQRMSVRPSDVSQALLDMNPQVVHFSGHGTSAGALCFEDTLGEVHPVQPEALAALFELFANRVHCVILNACYSDTQAKAIAKHVEYVIGMSKAIGDKAAIAFAIGFYQALGAGRSIEEAYKLGCIQIQLQNIPEHSTPTLIKKEGASSTHLFESQTRENRVTLETFCINPAKCNYKEHIFDPNKPFWPDEDTGGVTYHGGDGGISVYGKYFPSWNEANEYKASLETTRNHRSFSNESIHKIYFERLSDGKGPNYPDFYFSVSNNMTGHIVLKAIETEVLGVHPLVSMGESHILPSVATYEMRIAPHKGTSRISLIPSLKIEAGDAIAFDVFLIPETSRVGGYSWLMKFKVYYSGEGLIETDYFALIM